MERAEEVTKPEPETFHRIVVDLAYAIAVVIARELVAPMIDCGMPTARRRQRVVSVPFIRHDHRVGSRCENDERFEGATRTAKRLPHDDVTGLAAYGAEHRGSIVLKRAVRIQLERTPPWRVVGVRMAPALFPGILVHLVDFDDRVRERGGGKVVRGRGPERGAASPTSDVG